MRRKRRRRRRRRLQQVVVVEGVEVRRRAPRPPRLSACGISSMARAEEEVAQVALLRPFWTIRSYLLTPPTRRMVLVLLQGRAR